MTRTNPFFKTRDDEVIQWQKTIKPNSKDYKVFKDEAYWARAWDPRVLDSIISTEDDWYNTIKGLHDGLIKTPFDEYGNYKKRQAPTHVEVMEEASGL